jgi:two-component system chemotaxis response regulator CheB
MIHYALPHAPADVKHEESFRYGDLAIPSLIDELCRMTGASPSQLVAKITGGAAETSGQPSSLQAGPLNIEVAKSLLARHRIPIVGEDVGGSEGRKVLFHTDTGKLMVSNIARSTSPQAHSHSPSSGPQPSRVRKVLIVDDSKTIRDLLARILQEDPDLQIVGHAADAQEASRLLSREKPDVVTLDNHMPGMTGVEWLEKIMPSNPIPVVMISSLQKQEGNDVFRALELGAIDYIQKPVLSELTVAAPLIREKVKAASFAKVIRNTRSVSQRTFNGEIDLRTVLAIGASTGGTEALRQVLCALPERIPPIVIVQHIPAVYSTAFANRMNDLCPFEVKEAEDGDELKVSRVLIAPGGKQMKVQQSGGGVIVRVTDDAPMSRHKPSVDFLFQSVASVIGSKAMGVILTGMGSDGAKGLLEMKRKGAKTIGQDEESCVVYGMPRIAYEMGAVDKVASLSEIPRLIIKLLERK